MLKGNLRKSMLVLGLICCSNVLSPSGATPQSAEIAGSPSNAAELLAARELGRTPMLDDLRELCDSIGGRPTGSPACDRAVDWAVGRFRAAGLESTWTEAYTIPTSWKGGADEAECLAPARFPIRVASAPFSAPTPGGRALEALVVNAGDGSPEAFARLGDRARGAIALVSRAALGACGKPEASCPPPIARGSGANSARHPAGRTDEDLRPMAGMDGGQAWRQRLSR